MHFDDEIPHAHLVIYAKNYKTTIALEGASLHSIN